MALLYGTESDINMCGPAPARHGVQYCLILSKPNANAAVT